MRKIISLSLIACMVLSVVPMASATRDYAQGTDVTYVGQSSESYTITVPALMAPGDESTVTLSGTWPSDRTVNVSADPTVTLVNSINAADEKTLDVTFPTMSKAGDNSEAKTYTETVSVAEMPSSALFGVWSGKFNYNVSVTDTVKKPMFSIVHKPTNTVTTPESTFEVFGYDVYPGTGHSPNEDGSIHTFYADDEYHVVVNGLPFPVDEIVTTDFEAEYHGPASVAHVDTNLIGVTAEELCEYTFRAKWENGTSTDVEFSIEPYEVSEGLFIDIPCITYAYFTASGVDTGWRAGPFAIYLYDEATHTFTLATTQDTLHEGIELYIDGNWVLTSTALQALSNLG